MGSLIQDVQEVKCIINDMIQDILNDACGQISRYYKSTDFLDWAQNFETLSEFGNIIFDLLENNNISFTHTKQIYIEGGGEGGNEDVEMVIAYKDKFLKMEFGYMSYNGYDFNNLRLTWVVPTEVMVTNTPICTK